MNDFNYELLETVGVLSTSAKGWTTEVNLIKWEKSDAPKVDIRKWSPDHQTMSKGISLSREEARKLGNLLRGI